MSESKRVLDPVDRMSEVLFGLIMVLTFTGSLSVAQAGREDVRAMLVGAIGCNLAWGIIDGVFYLMASLAQRGHNLSMFRALRASADPADGRRILAGALPPLVASILDTGELERMRERLMQKPEPPPRAQLQQDDWMGAAGVLLLVFLSTFPVVIPFLVVHDAHRALRISNAIAVVMLFIVGYGYGRVSGYRPLLVGMSMIVLGLVLVGLTIALGG